MKLRLKKHSESFLGLSETKLIVSLVLGAFVFFEAIINFFATSNPLWAQFIALIIMFAFFYLLASLLIWLSTKYKSLGSVLRICFYFLVLIDILAIITVTTVRLAA